MCFLRVLASVFSLSTSNKAGSAAALLLLFWYHFAHFSAAVVVGIEVVQFRNPRVLSGLARKSISSCWFHWPTVPCIDLSEWLVERPRPQWGMRIFFLGWRVRLLLRVCAYAVRGRWSWDFLKFVITDTWNRAITPGLPGREMAMSPPRFAPLFSLHSDFSQDVGAQRAVPNVKREVFCSLMCHWDDTGASVLVVGCLSSSPV